MSVRKKIEQRGTCAGVVTRDVAVREGVMGAGAHKAPDVRRMFALGKLVAYRGS